MLSKRLKTVAFLVTRGNTVADIGTDHGYVPIYLMEEHIASFVYAMDVNEGPLNKAKTNIKKHDLDDCIETILSDGFDNFGDRTADTVVIAGMGGDLIVDILTRAKTYSFRELVLSPHKRVDLVRKYLCENGYQIVDEKLIEDGGKYYPIIKGALTGKSENLTDVELEFGPFLLETKDVTLKAFLDLKYQKFSRIKSGLDREDEELDKKIQLIKSGLSYYK